MQSKHFGCNTTRKQEKLAERMLNQYERTWSHAANVKSKNAKRKGWFKPWQT